MIECRNCREVFYEEREKLGARCPYCRMPLFERPNRERPGSPPAGDAGTCAVHANNPAVGTCKRCGTFMCALCRTRWHDRPMCLACVAHVLESVSANPQETSEHRRLAAFSLGLAITAWLCVILGSIAAAAIQFGSDQAGLAVLGGMLLLLSIFPAVFSVGQGAAAIRLRGDRMIYATSGLFLSATQLGVLIGLVFLNIWHQ